MKLLADVGPAHKIDARCSANHRSRHNARTSPPGARLAPPASERSNRYARRRLGNKGFIGENNHAPERRLPLYTGKPRAGSAAGPEIPGSPVGWRQPPACTLTVQSDMTPLAHQRLDTFLGKLGSKTPTPGGGPSPARPAPPPPLWPTWSSPTPSARRTSPSTSPARTGPAPP